MLRSAGPDEPASLTRRLPGFRSPASRHVPAFPVWDRRRRSVSGRLDRSASGDGPGLVAGAALGSHRLWRLAVPSPLVVRGVQADPGPLAGRLRLVPRAQGANRRRVVSPVAGTARPPNAGGARACAP